MEKLAPPSNLEENPPPGRRRRSGERGIALLMVLSMLVVMSTFIIEFQYTTRIRYQLAASYRDQVQAELLARSGVQIYVLLVMAVNNLAKNAMVKPYLEDMGIDAGDILTTLVPQIDTGLLRLIGAGVQSSDIQMDNDGAELKEGATPDSGGLLDGLLNDEEAATSLSQDGTGFMNFDGDFSASIEPEGGRININRLADGEFQTNPAAIALIAMMDDEQYTHMFRARNITPAELVGNLRDWIDADGQVTAGLGGLEDNYYSRLEDPYSAKNARFTSLSEVHLVQGWDDEMFEVFGKHLTIYGSDKINFAVADEQVIAGLLRAYCKPAPSTGALQEFFKSQEWLLIKPELAAMEPGIIINFLGSRGLSCPDLGTVIGKETLTYRISSSGQVNDVTRSIEAVITSKGRLIYWREN